MLRRQRLGVGGAGSKLQERETGGWRYLLDLRVIFTAPEASSQAHRAGRGVAVNKDYETFGRKLYFIVVSVSCA